MIFKNQNGTKVRKQKLSDLVLQQCLALPDVYWLWVKIIKYTVRETGVSLWKCMVLCTENHLVCAMVKACGHGWCLIKQSTYGMNYNEN